MPDNTDDLLDLIFDRVDGMLLMGLFQDVDDELAAIDVSSKSPEELIAFLTVTLAAKDRLPSRGDFFRRTAEELSKEYGDSVELFKGLA